MVQQMQEIEINDDDIPSIYIYIYILNSAWNNINEGLTTAVNDPSVLLEKFDIIEEKCNNLVKGITEGTACVISDKYFNPNSPIGPTGTSTVILAPIGTSEKSSMCNRD